MTEKSEGVTKGVAGHALVEAGQFGGFADGLLEAAFVDVMPAGKTYCQIHSRLAFGYLGSSA
ncbi:MAG TPA: hypothetical protein EYP04_03475 [Anaerolineae bacterium]|nr:hypothetical protein [Anaerolineae bacterium]HIQ05313.1 hypothetical protein [Anaerolineae bacterium]